MIVGCGLRSLDAAIAGGSLSFVYGWCALGHIDDGALRLCVVRVGCGWHSWIGICIRPLRFASLHLISHHFTSLLHTTPPHLISPHLISHYLISRRFTSLHLTSPHLTSLLHVDTFYVHDSSFNMFGVRVIGFSNISCQPKRAYQTSDSFCISTH